MVLAGYSSACLSDVVSHAVRVVLLMICAAGRYERGTCSCVDSSNKRSVLAAWCSLFVFLPLSLSLPLPFLRPCVVLYSIVAMAALTHYHIYSQHSLLTLTYPLETPPRQSSTKTKTHGDAFVGYVASQRGLHDRLQECKTEVFMFILPTMLRSTCLMGHLPNSGTGWLRLVDYT
jgi:hypothetical protein